MQSIIAMQVPDFKAQAFQNNEFIEVTQDSLKGKWAILFFYPADFSFVCPTELGDIADQYEKLQSINTEVYSVSTDSHFVHKAWWDASDTIKKVKFPMIADPTGALSRALGTYIEEDGMATRATFIIDPEGIIQVAEYSSTSIGRSAEEIVRKVQAAQFVAEHDGEVCPANWKPGSATLKPGLDLVGKI
ncbi:MAG: NADH-dependent peroxiredoxin subunit [Verrucomicrobiota bacterium]|jgi:peroxiredoxin (alkyl hydroperoxide reductase subunit C)|nr:NADH-dependent peroxiredoxin subunit [Verrucomicrobiota bacterium]MDK2964322.1 NADH-dependent peroxiredoxin subunit [Verrucomicrobiota bacterium]